MKTFPHLPKSRLVSARLLAVGWSLTLTLGIGIAGEQRPPPLPPLTNVEGSPRLPGKFVWADLVTDDLPAARNFYGHLFNWTFRDLGTYIIVENEDRPLCGMIRRPRDPSRPEAKPRWFGYISVRDVEKAQRTVTKAGGRVLVAPQKLPQRGEQAIFADPQGALFGVVRSRSGDPPDFLAGPGDWIWIQHLSRDSHQAAQFYRSIGGYEIVENRGAKGASDYVLASEGYARATLRTIPPGHDQLRPDWLLFVRVRNLGESLARTTQLNGTVRLAPKPELFEGKVAVISDPTGAPIGLMEWDDAWLKGGR
jgi:predicted enzyme related to lactoylglutathione lyase